MIFPGDVFSTNKQNLFGSSMVLVLTNIILFLVISLTFPDPRQNYSSLDYQFYTQKIVEMYVQTLDPIELQFRNKEDLQVSQVIRDIQFWHKAMNFPFKGDSVQINETKKFLFDLKNEYNQSAQYNFGLSSQPNSLWSWITYQFLHSNLVHLLGNVFFLFLITNWLRTKISDEWVYCIYVLSGVGGGVAYLTMNASNEIAVLGASGAICGLMSFAVIAFYNQTMPWSYFLSPVSGYYGVLYIPIVFIFPMYLISDFTTVLVSQSGVQSAIAHSAHIGGTIVGCVLGLFYIFDQKIKKWIIQEWLLKNQNELTLQEYQELRDKVSS